MSVSCLLMSFKGVLPHGSVSLGSRRPAHARPAHALPGADTQLPRASMHMRLYIVVLRQRHSVVVMSCPGQWEVVADSGRWVVALLWKAPSSRTRQGVARSSLRRRRAVPGPLHRHPAR